MAIEDGEWIMRGLDWDDPSHPELGGAHRLD